MNRSTTPRPPGRRLAVVAVTLSVACASVQAPSADAQTGTGQGDRVPSELWRTYPLDPSEGTATIERGNAPRPSSRAATLADESPGEPAGGAAEEPRAGGASGSRAGVVVVAAVAALGVLASLFVLLRFPAPSATRTPPRRAPARSGRRRPPGRNAVHGVRAEVGRRWQHWKDMREPIEPLPAGSAGPPLASAGEARTSTPSLEPAAATRPERTLRPRAPDVEELKAKRRARSDAERKRIADTDAELLKRKLAPDTRADVLKGKKRRVGEPPKILRAEPESRPGQGSGAPRIEPGPAVDSQRPQSAEPRLRRGVPLRPVRESGAPPPLRVAPVERPPECTIVWWRGYVKSRFLAIGDPEPGRDSVVAASPHFRWRQAEAPPETPVIAQALQALVESLELQGWRVSGRGKRWFSVRMQLTYGEEPVQVRQAEGPETGRKGSM